MQNWLRQLVRKLMLLSAACVIVLALALGAFRLLLMQLPSYQAELQQWVAAELGLTLEFVAVDARLGFKGPELTFHEASVAGSDAAAPFLFAGRAAITIDPWRFLLERELTVNRLTIDGTRVTIVRTGDGAYRVQGAGGLVSELEMPVPPEVEVAVRDSDVLYFDESTGDEWRFANVDMDLSRTAEHVALELRAEPPSALADRVELDVEGELGEHARPDRWRVFASLSAADIARLARLVPGLEPDGIAGHGDLSLWLDWADGPVRASGEVALEQFVPPGTGGDIYDRLAMRVEWAGQGPSTWEVALSDISLTRNGQAWPDGSYAHLALDADGGELGEIAVDGDYLRIEDLSPLLSLLPETAIVAQWRALAPRGELREFALRVERRDGVWDYDLSGRFSELAFSPARGLPGFDGLSGEVRADARSGRIEFATSDLAFDWPSVFPGTLPADRFEGIVVWRLGRDIIRLVSDDLVLEVLGARADSDLELTLPLDGSSPRLDLETQVGGFEIVAAKRFFPTEIMPPSVVRWLDGALAGGRVERAELSFFGPLAFFPFDDGDGQFSVAADVRDTQLDFVSDWPAAVDLDGTIEFVNAGFSASGSGRVLGNASRNIAVRIPDMRDPTLTVSATTRGELAEFVRFLNSAPLIARSLGPGSERVQALGGVGVVDFELDLPLLELTAYRLRGRLDIEDGVVGVEGLPAAATEVNGRLEIDDTAVTAQAIEAVFLDGPITARVEPAARPGYRARLELDGETTAEALADSFALPFGDRLAGQTRWQGRVDIPSVANDMFDEPLRVSVASNLTGVALKFPAPFAKTPAEPSNLQIELLFPGDEGLYIAGNLGATRRFALDFESRDGAYRLARGALQFGGEQAVLPSDSGFRVRGSLPLLDLNEWLAMTESSTLESPDGFSIDADLELAELFAFGQRLGMSRFSTRRGEDSWRIEVDSEPVAGVIDIPVDLDARPKIKADMTRLYLSGGDGDAVDIDPRRLPGLSLEAEQFGIGERFIGAAQVEVAADPLGLRLVSFESANEHLSIVGSGSWFWRAGDGTTRLALSVTSTDVSASLETLGFDPVIEGESAEVTASVHWAGGPKSGWLDHVNGDVGLRVQRGSMLDLEPGAGRVVGLMSIVALPRRLALDFRDVFNKGLVFDEIAGDFSLVDGNAYTDNLKLTGPGAEIGVVGRTGLRDQDYEQQAIVTAEPGNILPTVGGLLGGPGVGAALLIFTRIFKEPLRGIGQAAYCIKGSWDDPTVERLTAAQLEQNEFCAALPPADLTAREAN